MVLNLIRPSSDRGLVVGEGHRKGALSTAIGSYISSSCKCQKIVARGLRLPMAMIATIMLVGTVDPAASQSVSALGEPQPQMQGPAKPMTPQRMAWMKRRCAQLVAYYDYYGVSRGENSDGARNHTRIGASIECSRTHYRDGIDTIAALLVRKAFVVPKPGTAAIEPEDDGAPVDNNPTRRGAY